MSTTLPGGVDMYVYRFDLADSRTLLTPQESPGGYITSPVGSIRSGSWSHRSTQMARSTSRTSRLTQLPEPEQEGRPLDSPLIGSNPIPTIGPPQPPARRSFSREYENMAQEIRDQLNSISPEHKEVQPEDQNPQDGYEHIAEEIRNQLDWISSEHVEQAEQSPDDGISTDMLNEAEVLPSKHEESKDESHIEISVHEAPDLPSTNIESQGTGEEHPENHGRAITPPDRPSTAASGDTFQQARTLFHDFDGVHYAPSIRPRDEDVEDDDVPSLRNHPLIRGELGRPQSHIEPPPSDDMVYYPAPVPRTLNLPKRLSQLPAAALQAKRRSQVVGALPADVRKSAVWLPQPEHDGESISDRPSSKSTDRPHSKEKMDMGSLPPQLRASAYFDHPSVSQDVEVKGESAVATLDSILEASATAPVGAFTNHPISGAPGQEVYGKEAARRSTTSIIDKISPEKKKNRSTLDLLLGRRKSAVDPKQIMQKQNSSKLSLGAQLNEVEAGEEGEGEAHDEEDENEQEPEEQFFGPPSTLLAELQLRKHQQKQRNRTAATAFPNGMHSTLLELDAVAQVEKKRRMAQRPALAWEDSEARAAEEAEADDDDVPLGMLFPGRDGLINKGKGQSDWDRPLGLIEKRELEENEPLSRRRNRLRGISPNKRDASPAKRITGIPIKQDVPEAQPLEPEDAEEEDEPLAQRLRRIKNRETLNAALGDVARRPVSSDFASEVMSQLGGFEDKKETTQPDPIPPNEEEETLGQRRKRLQAEALAAVSPQSRNVSGGSAPQDASASRPSLKPTRSLANLLSANPVGSRQSSAERPKGTPPPGSLLHQNENRQERRKTKMLEQNRKGMVDGLAAPLVDVPQQPQSQPSVPTAHGFAGGMYNNGAGGAVSTPGFGYGGLQSPPVTSAGGMGMSQCMGMGMGMVSPPLTMGASPMTMPVTMNMGLGVGGMGAGYPSGMNGYFNNMAAQNHPLGYGHFQQPVGPMGVGMSTGFGMSGMPGQYGYGQSNAMAMGSGAEVGEMNQKQREMIDRWRQSIA